MNSKRKIILVLIILFLVIGLFGLKFALASYLNQGLNLNKGIVASIFGGAPDTVEELLPYLEQNISKTFSNNTATRMPFRPTSDGQGIIFELKMNYDMYDKDAETNRNIARKFNDLMTGMLNKFVCEDQEHFGPFLKKGKYVEFISGDRLVRDAVHFKVDTEFCERSAIKKRLDKEAGNTNTSELITKQREQGYYDDDYLNQHIAELEKEYMPLPLGKTHLEIYDSMAKDRVYTYYVHPVANTITNEEYQREVEEMKPGFMEAMLHNYCTNPTSNTFLKRVKAIAYVYEGAEAYNFTITVKDCEEEPKKPENPVTP